MAKIAVLGYGVVGSGTVEVFYKNKKSLEEKAGQALDIKYILDLRDFPDSPYQDKFVKDFNIILNDPEISVVTEVIGGLKPAYDFVKSSLLAGKSVVTSNKELVAAKGAELLAIAKEKNVNFFFEASVGGGIPILGTLTGPLRANKFEEVMGILNGTTNYILTMMTKEGLDYETALKDAQEQGFAEADPTADVEGIDAANKLTILMALMFDKYVAPQDIPTTGITEITKEKIEEARSNGCKIKLIAHAWREDGEIKYEVRPMYISATHPLANINKEFNAVFVKGNAVDDVMFYGKGAGPLPTGSAVLGDVIDISMMILK